MADYNLGSAHGEITIKYDGKGAKEAQQDVEELEKSSTKTDASAKRTADAADKLANGMAVVGGAAVAGLALAVRSATNFEDALAGVRAAGNASAEEMDKLRGKALQLGADTKFSATEAASAMEALIKAGLTTSDVLNGAADAAVNLAAAERIDLTQASEIAATAMTAFNLKASDLPKIADTISRSASATKQTVSDFAQAMNQAGAVSKLVGLNFDDMALAITAMGKSGIVGSDAGTSLKTMLLNLQPATKKQSTLMKDLGIITKTGANQFFDATGKIKPMVEIAGVLEKALRGMTQEQKLATLETLFGSDAIRASAIVSEQGAAGMQKLREEMGQQLSVSEKAKIQMSSFAGTLENFKGTVETAAIKLGTVLLPVLDKIVKMIGGVVDWFSKLPPSIQSVIVWVIAISALLLLAGSAIIKIILLVQKFIAVLSVLRVAFIALYAAMPWLLIVAALAIAVLLIIKYWDEILAFLTMVWTAIRDFAVSLWTTIRDFVVGVQMSIAEFIISTWNSIVNFIVSVLTSIRDFFVNTWNAIWGFITGLIGRIIGLFRDGFNETKNAVSNAIQSILQWFADLPGNILRAVGNLGRLLWDAGKAIIQGLLDGINSMFGAVMNRIGSIGSAVGNAFSSVLSIFSPSKVFEKYGIFTMEGYIVGVDKMEPRVLGTVEDIAANVAIAGNPALTVPAGGSIASFTRGGDGAASSDGSNVTIGTLVLNVAGNLDPSNPTEFRKTIKKIKSGIEGVTKEGV
jgi:TP901 family phage tail tape measure protein